MNLSEILAQPMREGKFWTHSKQLISGCTKVSLGCLNCWAEAISLRFPPWVAFDGTVIEHPERLADILPKSNRRSPRVWAYWNDVFHEGVSDEFRSTFFSYMKNAYLDHGSKDFHIICTKRPEVATAFLTPENTYKFRILKEKIIILISVENQDWLYARRGEALQLWRMGWDFGLLAEPMLGPIDLETIAVLPKWIICGPENGKGKRPFKQEWAMRLQAQAKAAGVPFFYKANRGFIGGKGPFLECPSLLNGKRYTETPE